MILALRIKNFGILSSAEIEFGEGLQCFTGETGAGKSMIVDAVEVCLGGRASADMVRSGADKAVIQMVLACDEKVLSHMDRETKEMVEDPSEILLEREVTSQGRSYARINGHLVTAQMLQKTGQALVDIHGQHEHQSLLRPASYLDFIDGVNKDIITLREEFHSLYVRRQSEMEKMRSLVLDEKERKRQIDLLQYQVDEIEKARIEPGEESKLREEYRKLSALERLRSICVECRELLYESPYGMACSDSLGKAVSLFREASSLDPTAERVFSALNEVGIYLETALDLLRKYESSLDVQPDRLREVEERLDLIARLKDKYGRDERAILEYLERAKQDLAKLGSAEETLAVLKENLGRIEDEMTKKARELHELRLEASRELEKTVTADLESLGMPGGVLAVSVITDEDPEGIPFGNGRAKVHPYGIDRVEIAFSANPGEPPRPLNKVASGGELSRLTLALKAFLADRDPVPTLIFDEIDPGVGGRAGQAVAEKLARLGRYHQVFCVTHLASIAAASHGHYLVEKVEEGGRTVALVRRVDGEEREKEIARMLSGKPSETSLAHARELLAWGASVRLSL